MAAQKSVTTSFSDIYDDLRGGLYYFYVERGFADVLDTLVRGSVGGNDLSFAVERGDGCLSGMCCGFQLGNLAPGNPVDDTLFHHSCVA